MMISNNSKQELTYKVKNKLAKPLTKMESTMKLLRRKEHNVTTKSQTMLMAGRLYKKQNNYI